MSTPLDRELISQAVIVLGVCIGTWMLFVEPQSTLLARMEGELAKERSRLGAVDEKRIRALSSRIPEVRAELSGIERRNRMARDSAALYTQVMSLAQQRGIQVRTLEPNVQDGGDNVAITRIVIAVEGDYARLANFVQSLGDVETFLRISTITVSPAERDGRAITTMQINCEALAFKIPEELAALEGAES